MSLLPGGQAAPSGVFLSQGGRRRTHACSGRPQKDRDTGFSGKNRKVLALNSGPRRCPRDSASASASLSTVCSPSWAGLRNSPSPSSCKAPAPGSGRPQCLGPGRRGPLFLWAQRRPAAGPGLPGRAPTLYSARAGSWARPGRGGAGTSRQKRTEWGRERHVSRRRPVSTAGAGGPLCPAGTTGEPPATRWAPSQRTRTQEGPGPHPRPFPLHFTQGLGAALSRSGVRLPCSLFVGFVTRLGPRGF